MSEDHHRIQCAEIWGGVQRVDRDITSGPLKASVYSQPSDGEEGGDIYYFSVCGHDQLTRIAVADVQGHGQEVSRVSNWLYELIRDSMHTLDARHVLEKLNDRVIEHGFEAMSTVALLSYYVGDSRLFYSYAGHPPAFLERRGGGAWSPLKLEYRPVPTNLPLGIIPGMVYDQGELAIRPGDRLFLYSDGVTDSVDHSGEQRGERWIREHLDLHREKTVGGLKRSMVEGLAEPAPLKDDVTMMVVEVH